MEIEEHEMNFRECMRAHKAGKMCASFTRFSETNLRYSAKDTKKI